MSAVKQRNFNYGTVEDEPPPKKLVSEADIFIKQLAEKQRNTTVTLQEHLINPKEFTKGTETVPLASYSPGAVSLRRFQETTKHFDQVEMLKAAGLIDEDIQLFCDGLRGPDFVFGKHKNWEHSLLKQKLKQVQETVTKFQERTLSVDTTKKLQRHEIVENGLLVKPDSIETKLLKFALDNQKDKNKQVLPHPMNNIKQIEELRFAHLNEPYQPCISKIRRKARKLQNRIDNVGSERNNQTNKMPSIAGHSPLAIQSKWDVTEEVETKAPTVKKPYTCLPQNYYTVRNGEIIKLNKIEIEAKGLPVSPKLTMDEIKLLPKFQAYEPGNPSKVLYLKNLSNSVTDDELRHLFKNQDKNGDVAYRLMKGKMRGQAFVTFLDETVAGRALEEVNGTIIRNKPVVIQFGNVNNR